MQVYFHYREKMQDWLQKCSPPLPPQLKLCGCLLPWLLQLGPAHPWGQLIHIASAADCEGSEGGGSSRSSSLKAPILCHPRSTLSPPLLPPFANASHWCKLQWSASLQLGWEADHFLPCSSHAVIKLGSLSASAFVYRECANAVSGSPTLLGLMRVFKEHRKVRGFFFFCSEEAVDPMASDSILGCAIPDCNHLLPGLPSPHLCALTPSH